MCDVLSHFTIVERLQPEPPRDALLELPHVGPLEGHLQVGLAHEHDLQLRPSVRLDVRQEPDLFEDVRMQMLCLVNHDDGMCLEWDERDEELLQRTNQLVPARLHEP